MQVNLSVVAFAVPLLNRLWGVSATGVNIGLYVKFRAYMHSMLLSIEWM